MKRAIPVLLLVFAVVAAACTSKQPEPKPSGSATGEQGVALPVSLASFGSLTDVPLVTGPAYAGPATPRSLDAVSVARVLADALTPEVRAALEERGFAIVPSEERQFHWAYEHARYDGFPVYVTTDVAYHTWHLAFDKVLRDLEAQVFLPKLEELVTGLLDSARQQATELKGTPLEDAANRVVMIFQVAGGTLDLDVGTLPAEAEAELALIQQHSSVESSPILGSKIDYSLFTPRGHYTRSEELTRFFVAMSVLGQSAFCLPGTADCEGVDSLRAGILAARAFGPEDGDLAQLWRDIYEPTAFMVGSADDYTPFEVAEAAGDLSDPQRFSDDAEVSKVGEALAAARPVRIDPEKASMRLMGVRFVIDSFVLDQLIYPNVGTETDPRLLPSPLDLAASFGSGFAYDVQKAAGETDYENYDAKLDEMRTAISERDLADWGSTVYDGWLWALQPLWFEHGKAFPDYMRTDAWAAKDHQAGFGSYAELKHDTILFAKQAVAEGGDGEQPQLPRQWVEPDPAAFGRLAAVTTLLREGLDSRDLLPREQKDLLSDLAEMLAFFQRVAAAELADEPVASADNERLTDIGGELSGLWWRTSDVTGGGVSEADMDAAIVADIARGGNDVVEVGTGRADLIYVIVPDGEGGFEVARGSVFSYYEFRQPASDRLTDESWRQMLDGGEAPERPTWEGVFLAG